MLDGIRAELERQLETLLGEAEKPMTIEEIVPHLHPVMPTANDIADILADLVGKSDVRRDGSYYARPTPVPIDQLFRDAGARRRNAARTIVELIRALDDESGEGASLSALLQATSQRGISREDVLDVLSTLRVGGEAYSPRKDSVRLTKM